MMQIKGKKHQKLTRPIDKNFHKILSAGNFEYM